MSRVTTDNRSVPMESTAECVLGCRWGMIGWPAETRRAARRHVEQTGHEVRLETVRVTNYRPRQ